VIDPQTPATLYARTNGGVFKSTDGGADWSPVNTGLPSPNISALAVDPQTPATLYASVSMGSFAFPSSGAVFKSTDGGASWSAANAGLHAPIIHALAIDPQDPATVYAGTQGGGVLKSTDRGANWSAANTGLA